MTDFGDVGEFHEMAGLPRVGRPRDAGPRPWDQELVDFRVRFLREELKEFEDATAVRDHAEMADALVDLVYVAMGTAHLLGYPWEELWDEVQAANLRKVRAAADGSDSKRGSRWDVVKPPGWRPPDVAGVLRVRGWAVS